MTVDPAYATTSGCDSREYSSLDDDVWNSFWSTQLALPVAELSFDYVLQDSDMTSSDLTLATSRDNEFAYSAATTEINPFNAIGLINDFEVDALQQQQPASFADASLVGQVSHQTGGALYQPLHDNSPSYQQQVLYGYTDLEALTSALGPAFNNVNSLTDTSAALSIDVAAPVSATQPLMDSQAATQDYHERVLFYTGSGLDLVTASILAGGVSSFVPQTIDPALLQTATAHDGSPATSPSASSSSLTTPTSFLSDMPLSLGPSDLPIAYPLQSGFSPLASPPPTTCSSPSSPRKKKARHPAPPPPGNIKLDRATWEIFHSMKRDATDANGKTSCPVPGCHKQTAKFCASQFQRHMRSHCADFCFDCSFCGKELSRRDSLKRHKCPALR